MGPTYARAESVWRSLARDLRDALALRRRLEPRLRARGAQLVGAPQAAVGVASTRSAFIARAMPSASGRGSSVPSTLVRFADFGTHTSTVP